MGRQTKLVQYWFHWTLFSSTHLKFKHTLWCEVVGAHADSHVVGAALWVVVLVWAAGSDAEAVSGELDPGPCQSGHPSPGYGRGLGGNSIR